MDWFKRAVAILGVLAEEPTERGGVARRPCHHELCHEVTHDFLGARWSAHAPHRCSAIPLASNRRTRPTDCPTMGLPQVTTASTDMVRRPDPAEVKSVEITKLGGETRTLNLAGPGRRS